jgi:hypothetical protein
MDIDQLRLAAAIVHTVPDAELHLFGVGGTRRVVSYQDGGDLTPCQWRTRLIRAREQQVQPGTGVVGMAFGGSLRGIEGTGIARRDVEGAECWFSTLLCPTAIEAVLQECRVPVAPEHVSVAVRPDALLGVSAVRLRIAEPAYVEHLGEIGMVAAAACTVEEVLRDVRNGEGQRTSGPDRHRHDLDDEGPPGKGRPGRGWTGGS